MHTEGARSELRSTEFASWLQYARSPIGLNAAQDFWKLIWLRIVGSEQSEASCTHWC